jgi:hypothetical protein
MHTYIFGCFTLIYGNIILVEDLNDILLVTKECPYRKKNYISIGILKNSSGDKAYFTSKLGRLDIKPNKKIK